MRVGINLLYLLPGVVGGTETYARELLYALARVCEDTQFFVFLAEEAADWALPSAGGFTRVVCPVRASSRPRRYLWEQAVLPAMVSQYQVDVLHSLGYVGPVRGQCPHVVTVHDLNFSSRMVVMSRFRRTALRLFVGLGVKHSDHIVAVSDYTRQQILMRYGLTEAKVTTVYEASSLPVPADGEIERVVRRYALPRPYILGLSGTSPHKNIGTLLRAFGELSNTIPHGLVLAGHVPEALHSEVRAMSAGSRVHRVGFVPKRDLAALFAGADLFVFPSLHEGFGLPALDAQRLGVPLVAARSGSLPEIAGKGAEYFEPTTVQGLVSAVRSAMSPERRTQLVALARQNEVRFSWDLAAVQTHSVYSRIARTNG